MKVLENLKPQSVFHYFEEICNIPHGSGNVDAISDYLVDFAKNRNLEVIQDSMKNVIISKPASEGYEDQEGIILQGHMDMVAVHKPELDIDMKKDPLKLAIDGDFIYAEGTSLGGDDGIAVAYALAILDDDSIAHPHLDVIVTVDEEVGMDGAMAIDMSAVKGTRLLNLDSEDEGYFLAGCAGGASVRHIFDMKREKKSGVLFTCKICGLAGGHSGGEIHKERGNANALTGRLLNAVLKEDAVGIVFIHGGLADNAIPRETDCCFVVSAEKTANVKDAIVAFENILKFELSTKDPDVQIQITEGANVTEEVLDAASANTLVKVLLAMPNGVQAMSADVPGLVQTSLNNGIIKLEENEFYFITSVRSSVGSEKDALIDKISAITELAGGHVKINGSYPGWTYRKESPFRDLCEKVYTEMYGKKPVIQAIHAGVECGLLLEKRPELDCISMGPDMRSIHTTEEKLSISSSARVWEYLLKLLAAK